MYKNAIESFCGDDPDKIRLFAAGFVNGQSEKVYLGACQAAMFRPSHDRRDMLMEIVENAAIRYGLAVVIVRAEIWICRLASFNTVQQLKSLEENSAAWHQLRGQLCGVPEIEIDVTFHHRSGYGQRCD